MLNSGRFLLPHVSDLEISRIPERYEYLEGSVRHGQPSPDEKDNSEQCKRMG